MSIRDLHLFLDVWKHLLIKRDVQKAYAEK